MTRRASDIFAKGMLTDATLPPPGALLKMHDCYQLRTGELVGRGGRVAPASGTTISTSASNVWAGASEAKFHSDLGAMVCHGVVAATATGVFGVTAATAYDMHTLELTSIDDHWIGGDFSALWKNHGSACLTTVAGATSPFELSWQSTLLPNEIVMAGYAGKLVKWGGSHNATASAASASGAYWTSGTNLINGSSTTWATQLEAGMYILLDHASCEDGTSGEQVALRIQKVVSNTQIAVDRKMNFTLDGTARVPWRATPIAVVQSGGASAQAWNVQDNRPRTIGVCCYHQDRLFTAGVADDQFNSVFDYSASRWSGNRASNSQAQYSGIDYWHPAARIEVMPGVGGVIRGMVSMGSELVYIKSNALVRLQGVVTDDSAASATLDVITNGVGAQGWQAWKMTKAGLIFAHKEGLHLYDGKSVTNLTIGKVQAYWNAKLSDKSELIVNVVGNRVFVSGPRETTSTLVLDLDTGLFNTQSTYAQRAAIRMHNASDEWEGDWGFHEYPAAGGTSTKYSSIHRELIDNPMGGTASGGNDSYGGGVTAANPRPDVWLAFPLGEDAVGEGRVNNIFTTMMLEGSGANLEARLYHGLKGIDSSGSSVPSWTAEVVPYEMDDNTKERTYRLDPEGTEYHSYARLRLTVDAAYSNFRLYAVAIDVEPGETIYSDYTATD